MSLPFPNLQAIYAAIAAGQYDDFVFNKTGLSASVAGNWMSTWADVGIPIAGSTDSGGTQYVNGSGGSGASANKGAFTFAQPAVSPQGRVGVEFGVASTQPVNAIVADRLCAIGPITVTATGSIALTTLPALPRYTDGFGVEVWLEVTTAFVTNAGAFFLDSYTGTASPAATSAGSGNLAVASAATQKVGTMIGPFPLLAADAGVKAVASINCTVAPTAGAVNVVLLKRLPTLCVVPLAGTANSTNLAAQLMSLPVIPDGASLFVMYQTLSTSVDTTIDGHFLSAFQ